MHVDHMAPYRAYRSCWVRSRLQTTHSLSPEHVSMQHDGSGHSHIKRLDAVSVLGNIDEGINNSSLLTVHARS